MRACILISLLSASLMASALPSIICYTGSVVCGKSCCETTLIADVHHFCADASRSLCCLEGQKAIDGVCVTISPPGGCVNPVCAPGQLCPEYRCVEEVEA